MTSPGPDPTAPGPVPAPGHGGPAPTYGGPPQMPGGPLPGQPPWGGPPPAPGYPSGYVYPPAYGHPPVTQPPPVPPGMVLVPGRAPLRAASPSQRVVGRLVDSGGYAVLIAVAVFGIVVGVRHTLDSTRLNRFGYPSSDRGGLAVLWIYGGIFAVWLIIVLYESLMIGLTGATLGDRVSGVRFVRTRDGEPPGFWRGLGRGGFLGVSFLGCYGLAFLLMLFSLFFDSASGRYQSWPDKIFGLQAVSTRG